MCVSEPVCFYPHGLMPMASTCELMKSRMIVEGCVGACRMRKGLFFQNFPFILIRRSGNNMQSFDLIAVHRHDYLPFNFRGSCCICEFDVGWQLGSKIVQKYHYCLIKHFDKELKVYRAMCANVHVVKLLEE